MRSYRLLSACICLYLCWLLPLPAHSATQQAQPTAVSTTRQAPPSPTLGTGMNQPQVKKTFENFPVNIEAFKLVNGHHSSALDFFFSYYYWLGNGFFLIPVALFAFIWRRNKFSTLLLAIAVETIIVQVVKGAFNQPRPPLVFGLDHMHLLNIPNVQHAPDHILQHFSFPSGDAAQAFMTAAVLMVDEKWYVQALLFLYAVLIAYERMYVGAHFPLDVMTGALIGILSAALALRVIQRNGKSKEVKQAQGDKKSSG